jgi:8-oxo-dGTP diphosphatase
MKPVKRSVAVVVRRPACPPGGDARRDGDQAGAGAFLVVLRPDDPADPLGGAWGLPAVTLHDGEDEHGAVVRAGRAKLGVELAPGRRIGEKSADRDGYLLRLADYEATIVSGVPGVPQPDASMTQYAACRFTADPAVLDEAAARGSVCAQIFLEDSGTRLDPA